MTDALCPNCDGSGQIEKQSLNHAIGAATFDRRLCYMCNGTGRVPDRVAQRESVKSSRRAERQAKGLTMGQAASERAAEHFWRFCAPPRHGDVGR